MKAWSLSRPAKGLPSPASRTAKMPIVAAAIVVALAWSLVLSPRATAERAVVKVASAFMEGEASANCPTVSRLSLSATPCTDLDERAFAFSMMSQTGWWHADIEGDQARAWTTLAGNVPVEYELTRSNDHWFVVSGGVS